MQMYYFFVKFSTSLAMKKYLTNYKDTVELIRQYWNANYFLGTGVNENVIEIYFRMNLEY